MKKYFLNTPFGSWVKVFISAIILEIIISSMHNTNLFTWDLKMWQQIISAAFVGALPVIVNFFNPNDMRYGIKKISDKISENEIKNTNLVNGGIDEGFIGPKVPPPPPPPPTIKK